jgi:EthD domain
MIRLITCLKRRDDVSPEEFRRYWQDAAFDELIADIVKLSGAERCAKNLTLGVEANTLLMQERGLAEPFDGIIEYWWHDAANFEALYSSEARKALMQEMQDYQGRFADLAASTSFFTESRETC